MPLGGSLGCYTSIKKDKILLFLGLCHMSLCLLLDHLLDSFALLSRSCYFNLLAEGLLSEQLLEQELLLLATHLLY